MLPLAAGFVSTGAASTGVEVAGFGVAFEEAEELALAVGLLDDVGLGDGVGTAVAAVSAPEA